MAARIIHFGIDECYRLKVLRRAGYEVDDCRNFIQFRSALDCEIAADAVILNDSQGSVPLTAIPLARSRTTAPIILFPYSRRSYLWEQVDLVVPSFTPPKDWLLDFANLILRAGALRAYAELLQEHAEELSRAPAVACQQATQERLRSQENQRKALRLAIRRDPLSGRE